MPLLNLLGCRWNCQSLPVNIAVVCLKWHLLPGEKYFRIAVYVPPSVDFSYDFLWWCALTKIHLSPFDIPCPHDVSHPVVFYGGVFFLWDGRHILYLCRYFDGPFQCVYRSRVHGRLCRGKARNCRNSRTRGYFALFTLWR